MFKWTMDMLIHRIATLTLMVGLIAAAGCADERTDTGEAASPATSTQDATVVTTPAPGAKLNINTASEEELRTIPNVGDRMVHEFEEYRPYVSIQQFRREIGKYVDEDQVAAYEEYVFVPVSPNESDEATLMQIPGVDSQAAAELVAGRPYASNEAFLEALGAFVTAEELGQAEAYLASP